MRYNAGVSLLNIHCGVCTCMFMQTCIRQCILITVVCWSHVFSCLVSVLLCFFSSALLHLSKSLCRVFHVLSHLSLSHAFKCLVYVLHVCSKYY